jgi:hypothetical protein
MLNINPQNKKMILTIDGGGMRGTITIAMLAELERLTEKPCYELFDMVAGTSTGAIIAAGIAKRMTAQEILDKVYLKGLPKGFEGQAGFVKYVRYLFNGLRHLYDFRPFYEALGPLVEGTKIQDLTDPIVFFTVLDVRTSNTIYVVSKGPGAELVKDWPVSGAVAASGAAPIYFPPVADNLIDGGVGVHGNPCLAATIEAMEFIGGAEGFSPGNVIVMSLGTGYAPNKNGDGGAAKFRLWDWISYVIGEQLDESGLQQAYSTRAIYGDKVDFRRYNPYLTREKVFELLGLDTTGRPDPNHLGLDSFQPQDLVLMKDIGCAYANKIDWTRSSVMPWELQVGYPKPDDEKLEVDWSKTEYR